MGTQTEITGILQHGVTNGTDTAKAKPKCSLVIQRYIIDGVIIIRRSHSTLKASQESSLANTHYNLHQYGSIRSGIRPADGR